MTTVQKTTIDWLRFRTQAEPLEALEAMRPMFGDLGLKMGLKFGSRGFFGFQQGAQIHADDLVIGRMDYGGESQRGWVRVDIPGGGCEWVSDWGAAVEVEALPKAQLRRVDVALTTWRGEVSHERVLEAHRLGRFTIRRPPELRRIESSDPYAGRTCYIGNRESDKSMRCYEKGWEMLSVLPRTFDRSTIADVDGFPPADVYRCEVEFKAFNQDIPWAVIDRRDEYFAGSYPFCADVLPGVEPDILQRRPERTAQTSLAISLENCRIQFGPTLFTALVCHGGDILAVWDKVVGSKHNESLLQTGVLLVDHD